LQIRIHEDEVYFGEVWRSFFWWCRRMEASNADP
jgi:hypothetical protein